MYEKVGDLVGQANCIQSLGDIAFALSDHDTARARYEEALALYERIPKPFSIGWTHVRLARLGEASRTEHIEAARKAGTSIDRGDLVRELNEEFGQPDDSHDR